MKTTITGTACVITSALKLEDLKLLAKYNPSALTLYEKDEDGNKEPFFSVFVKPGCPGSINENGAVFGKASPEGFAQITMIVDAPADADLKEVVAEKCGKGLLKMAKFEEAIPAAVEALKAEKASILDSIEVVG